VHSPASACAALSLHCAALFLPCSVPHVLRVMTLLLPCAAVRAGDSGGGRVGRPHRLSPWPLCHHGREGHPPPKAGGEGARRHCGRGEGHGSQWASFTQELHAASAASSALGGVGWGVLAAAEDHAREPDPWCTRSRRTCSRRCTTLRFAQAMETAAAAWGVDFHFKEVPLEEASSGGAGGDPGRAAGRRRRPAAPSLREAFNDEEPGAGASSPRLAR